jgi:hypothetical protein
VIAEHKIDRFFDSFHQLGVLGQSVRARREVAGDDHDFAGRLVNGIIELAPRAMAAKFQVGVGEPGKTRYMFGHGGRCRSGGDSCNIFQVEKISRCEGQTPLIPKSIKSLVHLAGLPQALA